MLSASANTGALLRNWLTSAQSGSSCLSSRWARASPCSVSTMASNCSIARAAAISCSASVSSVGKGISAASAFQRSSKVRLCCWKCTKACTCCQSWSLCGLLPNTTMVSSNCFCVPLPSRPDKPNGRRPWARLSIAATTSGCACNSNDRLTGRATKALRPASASSISPLRLANSASTSSLPPRIRQACMGAAQLWAEVLICVRRVCSWPKCSTSAWACSRVSALLSSRRGTSPVLSLSCSWLS